MLYRDIVPTMTSNVVPSGICSANNFAVGAEAFRAFDDQAEGASTQWESQTLTGWLQYKFGTAKIVKGLALKANSTSFDNMPKNFSLQASNSGAFLGEQVTLTTQSNITFTASQRQIFIFTNSTAYLYYRLVITATGSGNIIIEEAELMDEYIVTAQTITGSATLISKGKPIPRAQITGSASISSAGDRRKNDHLFVMVQEIGRTTNMQTFNFVGEIEQPQTAKRIRRVNS